MNKKSRLRTQKQKKGRRVIVSLLVVAVLAVSGYYLDRHYGLTASLKEVVDNIKNSFSPKGPARGTFYDKNLKQLAVTLERVSIYARTREIDSIEETAAQLGKVLGLDSKKLEAQLKSGVLRLWIAKDISQEQESAVKELKLPGVYLQRDDKRFYPNDAEAARIIGTVDNGIGLSGVEFHYDRLLAGKKIKQLKEKQSLGDTLDLVLTLDLKIQDILESLVHEIAHLAEADKVAAYLLEDGTGEIISGVTFPEFNPNTFVKYSQKKTEDIFLHPLCIPEKFRIFLRDATMMLANGVHGLPPAAWSLVPENKELGGQLRLWEWLGLENQLTTDFFVPTQSDSDAGGRQEPATESTRYFAFVPESAPPLSLLTTFSILLDKGKKVHPFVVKKVLDQKTGAELLLDANEDSSHQEEHWSSDAEKRIRALFHSQARQGAAGTSFFRDSILVRVDQGRRNELLINDWIFVSLPAGSNDLSLLIVIQHKPPGVENKEAMKEKNIEQLVEEKAQRISVLHLIDSSVADVVEPEVRTGNNYQGDKNRPTESSAENRVPVSVEPATGVMPDLKGLSLRKSLRLLQGIHLQLNIQGTGKVIDQKPKPGASLKGKTECVLILERQEKIAPFRVSKGLPEKD